ncbi:hypothetical protein ACQEVF_52615 [Nonomuraea polychroma]|uniref:hypothetical protein n=1 Tax=Nonomuraea polychroma TaxID=46176 RepID=UPI003D8DAF72
MPTSPVDALLLGVRDDEDRLTNCTEAAPLGEAFDVMAFHDMTPGTGPLPMGVLGEVVQAWAGGQP